MDSAQDTLAGGFPHSEIFGSKLVRNSPKLIAAYHVLHRLSAPRHPPNALKALDHSHCRYPLTRLTCAKRSRQEKRPACFEICPIAGGLSLRVRATDPVQGLGQTFSLRCQKTRADKGRRTITIVSRTLARRQPAWQDENITRGLLPGGARRDRTDDLLLAKQALSQLSYGPAEYGRRTPDGRLSYSVIHATPVCLSPDNGGPG